MTAAAVLVLVLVPGTVLLASIAGIFSEALVKKKVMSESPLNLDREYGGGVWGRRDGRGPRVDGKLTERRG